MFINNWESRIIYYDKNVYRQLITLLIILIISQGKGRNVNYVPNVEIFDRNIT